MGTAVQVKKSESPEMSTRVISDEVRRDLEEWLFSKEDLIWRPPVELTQRDDEVELTAIVAGADPSKVEILVAPDLMLIRAPLRSNNLLRRKLSRSILFPHPINPESVCAEIKDGLLTVKAARAGARPMKNVLPWAA